MGEEGEYKAPIVKILIIFEIFGCEKNVFPL